MKSKLCAILVLVALSVSYAGTALAAAAAAGNLFTAAAGAQIQYSTDGGTSWKPLTKLSNNVVLTAFVAAAKDAYSLSTKHNQAPREYGTASTDTKLYFHDLAATSTGMTTLSSADTAQMTTWTSM